MNNRYLFFLIQLSLFFASCLKAQIVVPGYGVKEVVSGYDSDLEGEIIPYFSSYQQFARDALLTRCTDGEKIISWLSAAVPDTFQEDYCFFYFLAGHSTGTSRADRRFDFYINDEIYVTFIAPEKKKPPFSWSYTGRDSVQVLFEATFSDLYNDAHGNLFLKVPGKLIDPGKPMTFSIVGHNENSNDWFMIHRYRYAEKVIVEPTPLLVQTEDGAKQIVRVKADHTYSTEDTLRLKLGSRNYEYILRPGSNYFELPVDTFDAVSDERIHSEISNKFYSDVVVRFHPVHRREADIIHHSHNDIGYSNLQEEVAEIQTGNIRNALKLIEKTKDYPEGSRFEWNIESVWAIDNFLEVADSAEKEKFFDAVRRKQIGISGHYANILTGLCKPEELKWITERAVQLRNDFQLPVNSVMFTDIPGVSWSQVQALADDGFPYFSNGPNYQVRLPDKGERIGGTLREFGDKPFYWMGENGKSKILFWTAGRGYSMFHQIPDADLEEKRKDKIADYMNELDSIGYPYDIVQLRYNIKTDNGPTDSTLSDFVKAWNEKYISPKLNITTVSEMMERFEQRYGDKLPVLSGDFTPYWEDGAYSTAKEEGSVRVLSEKIIQLKKLYELNSPKEVDTSWFYRTRRSVVMFHEHTWGSWNSVSDPDIPFTIKQWEYKKNFLDSAEYYVRQIENAMLPSKKDFRKIEVWNTLAWKRNGYVETEWPIRDGAGTLIDDNGILVPYQYLKNGKICFIARDVPSSGKKTYSMTSLLRPEPTDRREFFSDYSFTIDSTSGAIKSLLTGDREWVDNSYFKGLQDAVYVAGLNPEFFYTSWCKKIETEELGKVVRKFVITCSLQGTSEVKYLITQFSSLNVLHLTTLINKNPIREKESIHIAFPLDFSDATTRVGIGDTCYTPEAGQLSAANRDFYSVQRWIDISTSTSGVTISSPQCALWEIGKIIDERRTNHGEKLWKKENHSSPTVFAYAMNNYWHTNYKADQDGLARFDFYLRLHDDFSLREAQKFGREVNEPLLIIRK